MASEAWRNGKLVTPLFLFLLFHLQISVISAKCRHDSHVLKSESLGLHSKQLDTTFPGVRSPAKSAALPALTQSPEGISRWRRALSGPDLSAAASGGGYGGYGGGGYGYNSCDCSGYDLIGLIAGGAALAAVATFLINQLINGGGGRALGLNWLPDGVVKIMAEMVPQPTEMFALKAVDRTCDVISDMERRQISVVENREGESRDGDCECFPGIAGALAGFAALGALIAFALAQVIANGGGGRSLDSEYSAEGEFVPGGLALAGAMLATLVSEDTSCLPHQLCRLNSRAQRAGYPYSYVVRVASLPLSWVLMKTTGEPMTSLCAGMTSLATNGRSCDVSFPRCAFK
ncbi:uncharacterized protein LOC122370836 [Amphibalanus amphitrite]|uniref:uncharacterized protein LOC122370836 n=1 Tax=Amphibalanus amphitrite TaxID=1232801 RepID=UPI001C9095F2|nr:uncharacterized protein LOC122370836 [Amphibalanus amphitrite]